MATRPTTPRIKFEEEATKLREQTKRRRLDCIRNKSIMTLDAPVRKFCMKVAEGMTPSDAAVFCGFEDPGKTAKQLMMRPTVKKALNVMIERTMKMSEITRDDVLDGFKDAIAIARTQSEPMTMIAGWREVGKMLGMYEAKLKIEITGGAGELERQLANMSDAELLRMVHARSSLLPPIEGEVVEDGEFTEEEPKDE
jgi:hypothetical protein